MVGSIPHFPFKGLALVGLGVLLATVIGGAGTVGAVAAGLLFLPLLFLKFLFVFFMIGLFLRLAGHGHGGGHGPWRRNRHQHGRDTRGRRSWSSETGPDEAVWRYRGRPMSGPMPPAPSAEQAEWEESLRQARREVDDLDAPYREPIIDPDGERPGD